MIHLWEYFEESDYEGDWLDGYGSEALTGSMSELLTGSTSEEEEYDEPEATSMPNEGIRINYKAVLKAFIPALKEEIKRIVTYFKFIYRHFINYLPRFLPLNRNHIIVNTALHNENKGRQTLQGNEINLVVNKDEQFDFDLDLVPGREAKIVTNSVTDLKTATPLEPEQFSYNTTIVPTRLSSTVTGCRPLAMQLQINNQLLGTVKSSVRQSLQLITTSGEIQLIIQLNNQTLKLRIQIENYSLLQQVQEVQAKPQPLRMLSNTKESMPVNSSQPIKNPSTNQEKYKKINLNIKVNYEDEIEKKKEKKE